ncbi:hypothetical protein P4639_22300 [Priestia megaterium]|uniref:hypothetical protein n=1 Tax=Priestia megaterium TaxID=1404 RepID=UPI002E1B60DA|nr:hypothetical protein [Priestia megaterium]
MKRRYRVTEAKFIDSYHYHGSWFEYDWEMTLELVGVKIQRTYSTWTEYKSLVGKVIEVDEQGLFKVVEENEE